MPSMPTTVRPNRLDQRSRLFSARVSPYGCEDLSGNVWEWTRSLWGKEYPYDPKKDGRENTSAGKDVARVLRGARSTTSRRVCAARSAVGTIRSIAFTSSVFGRGVPFLILWTLVPLRSVTLKSHRHP